MHENKYRFRPEQVILHIPHSSTFIPDKYRNLFYLDQSQIHEELLRMTDSYTDELFGHIKSVKIPEENRIIFPYSRLICDVERFRDDRVEGMADRGMGVCYRSTSLLEPLKLVTKDHKKEMLVLYDQHHAGLTALANRIIDCYGRCLLIDCHSFSSIQLPYEAYKTGTWTAEKGDPHQKRPDICIGTDPDFHTPGWLEILLTGFFEALEYKVSVNTPFSGTMVPLSYYHCDRRLQSIMIEINRRLYMNEITGKKTPGFNQVQEDLAKLLSMILIN